MLGRASGVSFGGGYDHSALKWLKNELKEIPNREEARKRMSGNHDAQDDSERMRLLAKIDVDKDDAEHAAADDGVLWCRDSTGWFLPVMSQKRHMLSLFSSVNPLPGICGSPSGLGGA